MITEFPINQAYHRTPIGKNILPEETEKILRGGIFHKGNLVISGRADDMIKMIEYLPLVTETEKIICEQMAKILGVEKISRNADFYQFGGDSLNAILLVTGCANFLFQSSDVYKYRTPEKLATFIDSNKISATRQVKNSTPRRLCKKNFSLQCKRCRKIISNAALSIRCTVLFSPPNKT